MSGAGGSGTPGPKSAFEATDAKFSKLSPDTQAALNKYLSDKVAVANRTTVTIQKVTQVNPQIEVPKYNRDRMTAEAFFQKCLIYFTSQNYSPDQYVAMIPTILKAEQQLWYDSICIKVATWDDFCREFREKYDNEQAKQARIQRLYNRRQQNDESVEQFVYEMLNLARQVNPTEREEVSLRRARDSLVPELATAIGELHVWSANQLIERAEVIHKLLKEKYAKEGSQVRLPPMQGFRQNQGNNRGMNNRGRYNSRGFFRGYRSGNIPHIPQTAQTNERKEEESQAGSSQNRGNNRGQRGSNGSRGTNQNNSCHTCGEIGHFARACPRGRGASSSQQSRGSLNYRGRP
jgi:hypothetical protein